jgi:hypothetical protein
VTQPGRHEVIGSGSERNGPINKRLGERGPAVDFSHSDLARGKQRPEQHGGGVGGGQDGLGLDPALELLVQAFDGVGGSRTLPLARRQAGEGEQLGTSKNPVVSSGGVV